MYPMKSCRATYLFIALITMCFLSCKNDKIARSSLDTLRIRIAKDPAKLNPVFNPSSASREVFQYIFLPLADYHPENLELYPILIEKIPEGKILSEAPYNGNLVFDLKILEDAVWSDGRQVTGEDYAFTVKAVKLPISNANAWRPYFTFIKDVIVDKENPKTFQVVVDKDYMLAKEICVTMYILPKHIYDKTNTLATLPNNVEFQKDYTPTENIKAFADEFNKVKYLRDTLISAGPYALEYWTANQSIGLTKVENYWGANYPDNPFLQQGTNNLIFHIIPDENSALTAFKGNEIDVLPMQNSAIFQEMKSDQTNNADLDFLSPALIRYYYIAINNQSDKLKDKRVRRALANLFDLDNIIKTIDYGFGKRLIGHFSPEKDYYNSSLPPIPYDINAAKVSLKEAGWIDSNNNSLVDKNIDGKLVELELDILISGSALGETIALIFQEAASKAGIKINIVRKKMSLMRKENLTPRAFDLAALVISQDAAPDDPYTRWHSESSRNFYGYSNPEADRLMEVIRTTKDVEKRKTSYLELQKIMYNDQPVIWLYSPNQKILVNKNIASSSTTKRPGYLANTFGPEVSSDK